MYEYLHDLLLSSFKYIHLHGINSDAGSCESHVTHQVTPVGRDTGGDLSAVQLRVAWYRDQTLVPNLELNGGSHVSILSLYTWRQRFNSFNTGKLLTPNSHLTELTPFSQSK